MTPALWAVFGVVLVAVTALGYKLTRYQMPDDAFIFYRYAHNIASGDGWAYNVGVGDSNGATAPIWTALLALFALVTDNLASVGGGLYGLGAIVAALATAASLTRLGERNAGLIAGPVALINPHFLSLRGMESGLYLGLFALVLHWGLVRRRPVLAGAAGGLLVLTRPEGAFLLLLVGIVRWVRDRKLPWQMALSSVAAAVPWLVFSFIQFGTPLSSTLAAKIAQGRSGYWGDRFEFFRHFGQVITQPWSQLLVVGAAAGFVVAVRRVELRDYVLVLVGSQVLHLIGYGLVIRPPAYSWYYASEYFTAAILSGIAAHAAIGWLAARLGPAHVARASAIGGVVLVVAYIGVCLPKMKDNDGLAGYVTAAAWFDETTPADASISATEIGVLGWHTDHRIIDYLGLLDTKSADELRVRDVTSWFHRDRPDYVIVHIPVWDLESPTVREPEFVDRFEPVAETELDHNAGGERTHIRIYRRGATRSADATSPLLTDWLVDEFRDAGVDLDETDRAALAAVLVDYAGSEALQDEFETVDGIDFATLMARYAEDPTTVPTDLRSTVTELAERLAGRPLTTTLAPRIGD